MIHNSQWAAWPYQARDYGETIPTKIAAIPVSCQLITCMTDGVCRTTNKPSPVDQ